MLRNLLVDMVVRLLVGNLSQIPGTTLSKDAEDGMLAQMWESPAFRKRVADRDAKLIYTMAGGEGMGPEPREKYMLHAGQRVENLLWARDAKAAYLRVQKAREEGKVVG